MFDKDSYLLQNFFGSRLLVGILSISIISGRVRVSSSLALDILQQKLSSLG
jgi:hypothetical protein